MRFIRERAGESINVEDVPGRFRRAFVRSVHDIMVEARLVPVKALLAETDLLKRRTGWTPAPYRQEYGRKTPRDGL